MSTNHRDAWAALFDPQRVKSALAELRHRANEDDPEAQWLLANWMSYSPKTGYRRPGTRAASWLIRSSEHGYVPAMVEAAHYFETTSGPNRDVARAERLYRGAAKQGSANAAWALGLNAEGSFQDGARLRAAYAWFRRAASLQPEFGWKNGEYVLAGIVGEGRAAEGMRFLKVAAQNGKSAEAEFYLGLRSYLGIGCPVDLSDAMKWLGRAASNPLATSTDCGERCAHALLGRQLAFSRRTRREGIQHLEFAANAGLPLAQVDLALALITLGRSWSSCAKMLRTAVRRYQGPWRQPGSVWLGIERLTSERMQLATGLLGLPALQASSFERVTEKFGRRL